jgi:hypothetical protein
LDISIIKLNANYFYSGFACFLLKALANVAEFRQNMNLNDNDSHYSGSGKHAADAKQNWKVL